MYVVLVGAEPIANWLPGSTGEGARRVGAQQSHQRHISERPTPLRYPPRPAAYKYASLRATSRALVVKPRSGGPKTCSEYSLPLQRCRSPRIRWQCSGPDPGMLPCANIYRCLSPLESWRARAGAHMVKKDEKWSIGYTNASVHVATWVINHNS